MFIALACQNQSTDQTSNADTAYILAYNVYVPDSVNDDNYEIFTMEMDGSNKQNITMHPDVAWTYLAINEDIFFISDRDTCNRCFYLYEMNAVGENIRQITDFKLRDSWMGVRKNGKELIVNPHSSVDSAFYIIDRNGNILDKVYSGLQAASDPAFSPDGTSIIFRGGNKKSRREEGYREELYLMNEDGTGLEQITNYPMNDTTVAWHSYKAGPPRWHPTENFISYHSYQNGKYSLYAVRPDSKEQWKLSENPQDEGWHAWSSDGKWLAIELFDTDQTQFHIGLMNWPTKEMTILTDSTYTYQQAPVFVTKKENN